MPRAFSCALLVFGCNLCLAVAAAAEPVVPIDGRDAGRIFDGIGGLSAGASSRLLIDYPAKQRAEILDYLFKPNFGAGLTINKVEIGGDTNSTDGSEPSHMHTPDDENYQRGYEWWLMRESKRRNPAETLYALEWGTPGWINPAANNVWTERNIGYLLKWLDHARSDYGLQIDYIGGWNERGYDKAWYAAFRKALDAHGYARTRVVADDSFNWAVGKELDDPAFAAAFEVVGQHYPDYSPKVAENPGWQAALRSGKPLWGSEIGSQRFDTGAGNLARLYNQGYISSRMTAFINWSTIWSVYANLPYSGDGIMKANEPWSGHYTVGPSVWVTAQTTQFAVPGWRYLDKACAYFGGDSADGSYVALRSPNGRDFSLIAETVDARTAQSATFELTGGLSTSALHVWRTKLRSRKESDWFVRLPDLLPSEGRFTILCDPGCVYSFTTTHGQRKGATRIPAARPFALPYREDFQRYAIGGTPRFFADQQGTFEIVPARGGRSGKALAQVVTAKPVEWAADGDPSTLIGDPAWEDYAVTVDALLDGAGYVDLVGRMAGVSGSNNTNLINGYHLRLSDTGHWALIRKHDVTETVLAEGELPAAAGAGRWHTLALRFSDDSIDARIDGATVVNGLADSAYSRGVAGLQVSRWQTAQFMNFAVEPVPGSGPRLEQITAVATSFQPGYEPENAVGVGGGIWHVAYEPVRAPLPQSITLDLGKAVNVRGLRYLPRQDGNGNGNITEYAVYTSADGLSFTQAATGAWPDNPDEKRVIFAQVRARYLRLEARQGSGGFAAAASVRPLLAP